MYFPIAGIEVNPLLPFVAGFIVSFFCSMGGVSGANLLLPFQISILGFTAPAVSATNVAVLFYQAIAPFYPDLVVAPDWLLGVLFGLGGMVGMYLGARAQKFVPAKIIKWILAFILIFTALRYILPVVF